MPNKEKSREAIIKAITYKEAYDLCVNYIEGIKERESITKWCEDNGISYTSLYSMLNDKEGKKEWPRLVKKILETMYPEGTVDYNVKLFFEVS